jgi:bifunctional ADP-heptose synthase (sugar kinase/adenylyltransferase)
MLTKIEQALPESGALVLSDYAKGALTEVQSMIQLARKAGFLFWSIQRALTLSVIAARPC